MTAVAFVPESIADERDARTIAPGLFLGGEQPSEGRLQAKRFGPAGGHRACRDAFGVALSDDGGPDRIEGGRHGERAAVFHRLKRRAAAVDPANRAVGRARIFLHADEPIGVGERERAEERRIRDAEHRAVGAQPEGHDADRTGSERRGAAQAAERVAQVERDLAEQRAQAIAAAMRRRQRDELALEAGRRLGRAAVAGAHVGVECQLGPDLRTGIVVIGARTARHGSHRLVPESRRVTARANTVQSRVRLASAARPRGVSA